MRFGAFGRLPHDPARYAALPRLRGALAAAGGTVEGITVPDEVAWDRMVPSNGWGEYLNDRLGCCTAAGIGHAILSTDVGAPGTVRVPSDPEIETLYAESSGYVIGDPSTDRGATCAGVLDYVCRTGILLGGERTQFLGYGTVDVTSEDEMRLAAWLFGGLYCGIAVYSVNEDAPVWTDPGPAAGVAGLHCVWVPGVSRASGLRCVTWGEVQPADWGFWHRAAREAYAPLTPAWAAAGHNPAGLDRAALVSYLSRHVSVG